MSYHLSRTVHTSSATTVAASHHKENDTPAMPPLGPGDLVPPIHPLHQLGEVAVPLLTASIGFNRLRPGVQLIDGSKVRLMKQLTQLNQILTLIWWRDPAAFKALPNDPAIGPRSSPLSHVATGGRPCATRSKAARSPGRTRPRTGQTPWDRRCTAPAVATSPAGARVLQPAACTSSQIHRIMVSSEL